MGSSVHLQLQSGRKMMSEYEISKGSTNSSSIVNAGSFMLSPYHANSRLNPKTAIILLLVFTAFFILAFLLVYLKRLYNYHHSSSTTITTPYTMMMLGYGQSSTTTTTTTTTTSINEGEEQLGLDKRVLDSLPRVLFSSIKASLPSYMNSKKPSECAICLEEFGEKEILHVLPPCGHLFHSECIHMWLLTHTSCPLCRYSLLLYKKLPIDTNYQGEISIAMHGQQPFAAQLMIPNREINPTKEIPMQAMAVMNCCDNEGESSTMKPSTRRAKLERWHSTGRSLGGRGHIDYCIKNKEIDPPNTSPLLSLILGNFHKSRSSIALSDECHRSPATLLGHHIEYSSSSSCSSPTTLMKVPPPQMKDVGKSRSFSLKFLKRSSSDKFAMARDGDDSFKVTPTFSFMKKKA